MSNSLEARVTYSLKYLERKITDLRADMVRELEDLERYAKSGARDGAYDGRIHQTALRAMEKDSAIRALETQYTSLAAAVASVTGKAP